MRSFPPERIVCFTEETVETLYLIGEDGGSPASSATRFGRPGVTERQRVSAFTSADIPMILALASDLVLTFSDLQAEIAQALLREGITVFDFNQRDVAGILAMIRSLGAIVGATGRADALARGGAAREGPRGLGGPGAMSRSGTSR
jgi:iron complex transport system substrate-binding protein